MIARFRTPWCVGASAVVACCMAVAGGCASTKATATYDPEVARKAGADERGMRKYVFVVLKNGPKKMPPGPARDRMFEGHFANIKRLAGEGKLVLAGPFDGVDGWRGMFVFAVGSIDEAKACVALDPVIIEGEMIAEYHTYYGTAALMLTEDDQARVTKTPM